ncbi:hypothetical protein [Ostreiculturibacter nitratireducens]|uniref:hypothetical protein n=1 Tax=Ostreiculturibacter nitratireducens TaxID=3075226 RepID=UPI0031B611DC
MTARTYVDHLKEQLERVDGEIEMARRNLDEAGMAGKVEALKALVVLKDRHDELRDRIEHASERHAEEWSALHASFQEEADALKDELERWVTKNT